MKNDQQRLNLIRTRAPGHTGFFGIFLPAPTCGLTSPVRILKLEFLSHHWADNGENLLINRNFTPDSLKLILSFSFSFFETDS